MAFTAIPVDGSATPIPMSSAVPDGTNTPLATEGGPSKSTGGNTLVPVAVYEYDGYDVNAGSTLDPAVTGDATGTVSAKLRGLSKIFADMWDSTNHWMQVKVMNATALGQSAMTGSAPVAVASDQTPIAIKRAAVAVYTLASGALTASGNSGDLAVGLYTEIGIDINITVESGTTPTIQFFWNRKGADGIYYPLWQTKIVLGTDTLPEKFTASIGAGMNYNEHLGITGQLSWVVTGTTPSFTASANVYGK